MMLPLFLFLAFAAASGVEKRTTFASGPVSQACLECICKRASHGCRAIGCDMDSGSLSCGYFQIKEPYWIDCGRLGTSWKACAADLQCSSECVQNYMTRYAAHNNCSQTCEGYARTHNGGPKGCHSSATVHYWHSVTSQLGCSSVH